MINLRFIKIFCILDFDECSIPKMCSFNGDCINKIGSFECMVKNKHACFFLEFNPELFLGECYEGFYGHRCENCIKIKKS